MEDMMKVLIETEQRSKSNTHRLDQAEKKLEDYGAVITSIQVLGERLQRVDKDVGEIKTDVKTLMEKPAKKWESIVRTVVDAIIGGLVIYLLAKLGLGA